MIDLYYSCVQFMIFTDYMQMDVQLGTPGSGFTSCPRNALEKQLCASTPVRRGLEIGYHVRLSTRPMTDDLLCWRIHGKWQKRNTKCKCMHMCYLKFVALQIDQCIQIVVWMRTMTESFIWTKSSVYPKERPTRAQDSNIQTLTDLCKSDFLQSLRRRSKVRSLVLYMLVKWFTEWCMIQWK